MAYTAYRTYISIPTLQEIEEILGRNDLKDIERGIINDSIHIEEGGFGSVSA